ncbi:hypothetical protein EZN00_01234 [Clostridium tyrobutyricum]|nr:hypothetical protein EZN00_01234 [Clostridium tyrobutyricum]
MRDFRDNRKYNYRRWKCCRGKNLAQENGG